MKVVREEAVWTSGEECFEQREQQVQRPGGQEEATYVGDTARTEAGRQQ